MPTDVERLVLRLEVTQRQFEKQLAAANGTADRRARSMERRFQTASRRMSRSFERVGRSADHVFGGIARAAAAVGLALGTREIARYADAWTSVQNKIRAAEQISGTQARTTARLNDIAAKSRAGLEETADIYARMLRVSGDLGASEEEVAQVTETVAKAFKAGGAAASEQAAGILQLSQALSSGVLQGDELRSLRENAPIIAQAIADEFETTIGGLKELGAQGELTAERVFSALLKAQEGIEKAFASTVPTIGEGFTLLRNGMTELVGSFNEGSGAAGNLAGSMSDLGAFLSDNAEAAKRFGAQVAEAFGIMEENIRRVTEALGGMGGGLDVSGEDILAFVDRIISAFEVVISEAAGVAAAVGSGFLAAVDQVASGSVAIANAAIASIEAILNAVTAGINKLISGVNVLLGLREKYGLKLTGVETPKPIEPFSAVNLDRVKPPSGGNRDVAASYRNARDATRDALQDYFDERRGRVRRILRAGEDPAEGDPRGQFQLPPRRATSLSGRAVSPAQGAAGGGGGRSGGRGGQVVSPIFEGIDQQISDLERQIEMIGMTKGEIAKLKAETELLNEAQKRGLDLNARNAATGETLRQEIGRQAEAVGNLTDQYETAQARAEFFESAQRQLSDGFVDAIVEGENLSGVLQDLAKSLAKAALQGALFGQGPFAAAGGGGGLLGGIFGGLFGGIFGGKRATGGPVEAGKIYAVNENTPRTEWFAPKVPGTILRHDQVAGGGNGGVVDVRVYVDEDGNWRGEVSRISREVSASGDAMVARGLHRSNGQRINNYQRRGTN